MRGLLSICAVIVAGAALLDALILVDLVTTDRTAVSVRGYLSQSSDAQQWVRSVIHAMLSKTDAWRTTDAPAGWFFAVRAMALTGLAAVLFAVVEGRRKAPIA